MRNDNGDDGNPENVIKWIAGMAVFVGACFTIAAVLSGWNPFA